MIIGIGFIVAFIIVLITIGILSLCYGIGEDKFGAFLTGVILLIISIFLGFQIHKNISKIEDPNRESFYNIIRIEFVDGTFKQISILPNGEIINVTNIGEPKIYPENSILRRYGYKDPSGWIKYDNENYFYYEVILPNDEKYKEAKEKVIEVKITTIIKNNFPRVVK